MTFSTFTVGRGSLADIRYDDPRISRIHIEVTLTSENRLYIVDAGSTAFTFVWKGAEWEKLRQGYLADNEIVALGKMKVKATELKSKIAELNPAPVEQFEAVSIKPERLAGTGEVFKG